MRDDLLRPSKMTPGPAQPVDLGNPGAIAAIDLAQMAFRTLPEDDLRRRCPDVNRAEDLLGWNPAADLPEDLAFTSRHFRDRIAPGAPPRALANPETQVDRPHP